MNEVSRRLWSEEVRVDSEGLTCECRDFGGCGEGASQFIDIQGFDLVTTGMSQGLRQPRLSSLSPLKKAEGSPAARSPPRGCHGEHAERAALRHSHVGAFFWPPVLCSGPGEEGCFSHTMNRGPRVAAARARDCSALYEGKIKNGHLPTEPVRARTKKNTSALPSQ